MDNKPMEQKWPNTLILIRHGQSGRNVDKADSKKQAGNLYWTDGSVRDQDSPLTAVGMAQAAETGRQLAKLFLQYNPIDVLLVSPYMRTLQTAEGIRSGITNYQVSQVIEERIREIEFGVLDGLTPEGRKAKYPEEAERLLRVGKYWYRAPGGESRPDVRLRVHSVLSTLSREYRGQNVVIVCHSVVVLAFRSLLERWGEDEYLQIDKENDVLNCSITRYDYDAALRKLSQTYYNNTEHLKEVTRQDGRTTLQDLPV